MKRRTPSTRKNAKQRKSRRQLPAEKTDIPRIPKKTRRQKNTKEVSHKPIIGWRLWLFRFAALTIIPALLFLLLETTLRVIGYGFPTTITVKCRVNATASYCNNAKFAWQFFPPEVARTTDSFVFPADKSNNIYRIFVFGASAAAGTPDGAFCFGRILQVMLNQQYPQVNFEVITAAMPAINSHVVLKIAKDCVRHQPDLFIVYLGNNEVIGPYGAGTVFTPLSSNLSFIRFHIALKATKLGQLITKLLELVGASDVPEVWRGMEMFIEKQICADDPRLETVYRHFQSNLEDICRIARKSQTKVILCTVGSNLKDSPPFGSLHRPNLTNIEKQNWDELYQRGIIYETDGNYADAVEQYLEAAKIDDRYADLQFRLGRCYWSMDEFDKAQTRYIRARELDTLRFRADTRINEIIRDVASDLSHRKPSPMQKSKTAEGVYLVDAVRVFERNSPHETPGEELFYEHVHMNFKGGYLLARAIFTQTEKILPERIKRYRAVESSFPTEAECARFLAYTDWDQHQIAVKLLNEYIKKPPFTNQLYHNQRVRQMEQKLKVLKAHLSPETLDEVEVQYRWAIQQTPSDWWLYWKYSLLLEDLEKYNAAAEQFRLVLDFMPHHYEAYAKLGFLFGKQGNLDAAIAYDLKAVRIYPFYAGVYYNLGLAYHLQSKLNKAVDYYSKSIRFLPDQTPAYNNLAAVLLQQGKLNEAVEMYRKGLVFMPENLNLHYNLGLILKEQGRIDEAIRELRTALRIDPNSIKTRKALEAILKKAAD